MKFSLSNFSNIVFIIVIIYAVTGCVKIDLQASENRFYTNYDKNNNRFIEENEFQEFLEILYRDEKYFKQLEDKKMTLNQYKIDEFKMYDSNSDKKLSYIELEQHWGRKNYKRMDLNKNGKLEFQKEFGKFISKKAYKQYVNNNHKNSRNEKNIILPYVDFVQRVKNTINPNNDDIIEFDEFMNYIDVFGSCFFK
jgi:hypothetical protein